MSVINAKSTNTATALFMILITLSQNVIIIIYTVTILNRPNVSCKVSANNKLANADTVSLHQS